MVIIYSKLFIYGDTTGILGSPSVFNGSVLCLIAQAAAFHSSRGPSSHIAGLSTPHKDGTGIVKYKDALSERDFSMPAPFF